MLEISVRIPVAVSTLKMPPVVPSPEQHSPLSAMSRSPSGATAMPIGSAKSTSSSCDGAMLLETMLRIPLGVTRSTPPALPCVSGALEPL